MERKLAQLSFSVPINYQLCACQQQLPKIQLKYDVLFSFSFLNEASNVGDVS